MSLENYLVHVLLTAGLDLLLLLPFLLFAFITTGDRKAALRPVLLFLLLFIFDMALIFLPKEARIIPAWGGFNWQGKLLEMAWPLLLVALVPAFTAADTGFTLPAERRSWRTFLITCVVYALIGIPVMLLLGARFAPATASLPNYLYEASMPGLGEELVYRGILLLLLNQAFGRPWKLAGIQMGWGLIIISIMFGVLHGVDVEPNMPPVFHVSFMAMLFPFITGLLLGWLRERTGSVWPSVLLHNFINIINTMFV
jgi:uncharacterized protein